MQKIKFENKEIYIENGDLVIRVKPDTESINLTISNTEEFREKPSQCKNAELL